MSLRKAAEQALEALESVYGKGNRCEAAIKALRQALAQPEQEQKTPLKVLNLTVFTENRLRNGRVYDVETLQAMTNRDILAIPDMGKKALKEVMEALDVYAVNMNQERVDETAKGEQEPVAWFIQYEYRHEFLWRKPNELEQKTALEIKPLYTAPPISDYHEGWEEGFKAAKREWVGLTDEEVIKCFDSVAFGQVEDDLIINKHVNIFRAIHGIEARLKEKNT